MMEDVPRGETISGRLCRLSPHGARHTSPAVTATAAGGDEARQEAKRREEQRGEEGDGDGDGDDSRVLGCLEDIELI